MTTANPKTLTKQGLLPAPLRRLLEVQLVFTLMVWGLFVLVALGIILALARWDEVTSSIWQNASTGAARWYALVIGAYVGYTVLPLHITHGQTRREFSRQLTGFIALFAATASLLIVVGYPLEAALYSIGGWGREMEPNHLYSSPWQLHLIFIETWLILTLWAAGGAMMGTAFYRSQEVGGLAIFLAIVLAGVTGIVFGGDWGPFGWAYEQIFGENRVHDAIGVVIYFASIAVVLAVTKAIVSDVPVRSKQS